MADIPALPADDLADSPVLVVVVNNLPDLERARGERWYRIPVERAPARMGAEYLAFYQTAAFPPTERWAVRWLAPVHSYRLATRRELIPEERDHPRADSLYYRIALGACELLPQPIPSRQLRRITFIPTTLARIHSATEINDLWVKSTAQERLWEALKQAGIEAERQYPLREDLPQYVADFAVLLPAGRLAVMVIDEPSRANECHEEPAPDYVLAAAGWTALRLTCRQLVEQLEVCVADIVAFTRQWVMS